jgi:hypothetical protein
MLFQLNAFFFPFFGLIKNFFEEISLVIDFEE